MVVAGNDVLTVIVPSRGRPARVRALAEAFRETCTSRTRMVVVVDSDDPYMSDYATIPCDMIYVQPDTGTMVSALNLAARGQTRHSAQPSLAIGFMGDDHMPSTYGWDTAYLSVLRDMGTGIVYGNDLLQGENLPTQCAMTVDIIRALGYMAPPSLTHLFVDNFWSDIGRGANCITYLPDVVVEHLHPIAGKAPWDEGYIRVNDSSLYVTDSAVYEQYRRIGLVDDIAKIKELRNVTVGSDQ